MLRVSFFIALLLVTSVSRGADEIPKATRFIDGEKTTFPDKSIPEGIELLVAVLDNCHETSDGTVRYAADELKKARDGDRVEWTFPKPLRVEVRGKKLVLSEVVFAGGAFWLRCGDEIHRFTKYTHDKMKPFEEWYRQTLPRD